MPVPRTFIITIKNSWQPLIGLYHLGISAVYIYCNIVDLEITI
jgi:hypothetical protein